MKTFQLNHGVKQKKKKTNESSLSSLENECSDNETENYPLPQTTQTFPRFIIIEASDENSNIKSLSPIVIQKILQSLAGEPKSIKKLTRSNQLLIEVS